MCPVNWRRHPWIFTYLVPWCSRPFPSMTFLHAIKRRSQEGSVCPGKYVPRTPPPAPLFFSLGWTTFFVFRFRWGGGLREQHFSCWLLRGKINSGSATDRKEKLKHRHWCQRFKSSVIISLGLLQPLIFPVVRKSVIIVNKCLADHDSSQSAISYMICQLMRWYPSMSCQSLSKFFSCCPPLCLFRRSF